MQKSNALCVEKRFEFGHANDEQKRAITTVDGPVLIIAGPGTGKTFTLVKRAAYLIRVKKIAPEQIMMVTFTEKAAHELITRITNELADSNIHADLNKMYIGTFHSICLRILREHQDVNQGEAGFRVIEEFDQKYTVYKNIREFISLEGYCFEQNKYSSSIAETDEPIPQEKLITGETNWSQATAICSLVNQLSEELVDCDLLFDDSDTEVQLAGRIVGKYREILTSEKYKDFSALQVDAFNLLISNPQVLLELRSQIQYIMVDEYQDTNYIQERLVFLLAGTRKNLCVVGDDDQGLYRFRGATIRNILEFPGKFSIGECAIIRLETNYRSQYQIVDLYNNWMQQGVSWDKYRHEKTILANDNLDRSRRSIARLSYFCGGKYDSNDPWYQKVYEFLVDIKNKSIINNYNQVAFLFRSVKNADVIRLSQYLELHGIHVYSPRANQFFNRNEIRLTIGLLALLFPRFIAWKDSEKNRDSKALASILGYLNECIELARNKISLPEMSNLEEWVRKTAEQHNNLSVKADYGYRELIYRMFGFEPYKTYLAVDMKHGVMDERPARNLSILTTLIGKYEYQHYINCLDPERYEIDTIRLFTQFIRLLYEEGIDEYEDDTEYAPSDCVSFLTIHQSKGMEFPIVLVGSLLTYSKPDMRPSQRYIRSTINKISEKYFHRDPFEPAECITLYDIKRLFYTAFSRAQDLLVLASPEKASKMGRYMPGESFDYVFDALPQVNDETFDISDIEIQSIKNANIKQSFSFTTHVALYENCSKQYKFYRELGFDQKKTVAMVFGQVVHLTVEKINRAAKEGHIGVISDDEIENWFYENCMSVEKTEHVYLGKKQQEIGIDQVKAYAYIQGKELGKVCEAEYAVSDVNSDYIIDGAIDMICENGDGYDIFDFKTGKKEDVIGNPHLYNQYRRQLYMYAYLLQRQTNKIVHMLHLYFVGDKSNNPIISFPYSDDEARNGVGLFDQTVNKILSKEYTEGPCDPQLCTKCDFRYYCGKL